MLRTVYPRAQVLAALGLAACASEVPTAATTSEERAALHSLHASSPLPVRIEWDAALGAFLRTTDSALLAELANQTAE